MDDIWDVVSELALTLHPDRVRAIADKIGTLASPQEFAVAKGAFGPNIDAKLLQSFERAWAKQKSLFPKELSAALRSAAVTATLADRKESVELVWSGPSTGFVPVRHTEQVLCEVIRSARERIFIVSFVAYEIANVIIALNEVLARAVHVDILLEASESHGGTVTTDSVETMRKSVPGANIYTWSTDTERPGARPPNASVHAKSVVADANVAFITSANLSTSAMERNMELGVLVRGGTLPSSLHSHLDALKTTGIIEMV